MPGPARAGALIYAKDLERLSTFYRQLLGMKLLKADDTLHVMESPDFQLLIHAIPPHIAATFTIASPPVPREDCALKLFFTVESLSDAASEAAGMGGCVTGPVWDGPGFRVQNATDPEGNIFQVRESTD
jgi:predicted enzyme related to lactoylglutathione lyase